MKYPTYTNRLTGEQSIYHVDSRKCACKGTGKIPPVKPLNECQAFCPVHRCQRYWPQAQADGSIQFKPLTRNGLK
jgi:hypothetical protein